MISFVPISLADALAEKFGLPQLMIGEYQNRRVDYLWAALKLDQEDSPSLRCIVIQTDQGRWGMLERSKIKLVRLDDWEDSLFTLLKGGIEVPEVPFTVRGVDWFFCLTPTTDSLVQLASRKTTDANASQLKKALRQTIAEIQRRPALPFDVYGGAFGKDFTEILTGARRFGLSGIFGGAEAPHDLEYLIGVNYMHWDRLESGHMGMLDQRHYALAKTQRWLRGYRFPTFRTPQQEHSITDLPNPAEDVVALINDTPFSGHDIGFKSPYIKVSLGLTTQTDYIFKIFVIGTPPPHLWTVLQPLLTVLDERLE